MSGRRRAIRPAVLAVAVSRACDAIEAEARRLRFASGRASGGWLEGGCLVAAEAVRRVAGGDLAAIWGTFGDYSEDVLHVAAWVGDKLFDAEGARSVSGALERWALADSEGADFEMASSTKGIVDGDRDAEFWVERGVTVAEMKRADIPFSERLCKRLEARIREELR